MYIALVEMAASARAPKNLFLLENEPERYGPRS
jgi:hypothetical protein